MLLRVSESSRTVNESSKQSLLFSVVNTAHRPLSIPSAIDVDSTKEYFSVGCEEQV